MPAALLLGTVSFSSLSVVCIMILIAAVCHGDSVEKALPAMLITAIIAVVFTGFHLLTSPTNPQSKVLCSASVSYLFFIGSVFDVYLLRDTEKNERTPYLDSLGILVSACALTGVFTIDVQWHIAGLQYLESAFLVAMLFFIGVAIFHTARKQ